MACYVDGFVLVVPGRKLAAYRKMAALAGRVWREHGALQYVECVGDDLKVKAGCGLAFPKMAKAKKGERVLFSLIVYKSRAHRDRVNKKVMADPRLEKMCDIDDMPFDLKRMAYGGFKSIVDLRGK